MATDMILPVLGMDQDTGKVLQWLKAKGSSVIKGESVVEVETDKATVELEAPADGILDTIASAGDEIPVGHVIARILAPGERESSTAAVLISPIQGESLAVRAMESFATQQLSVEDQSNPSISPLAARMAAEYHLDLKEIKSAGKRLQKADVLTYIQNQQQRIPVVVTTSPAGLRPASPKARRIAAEQGKNLATIRGSGPEGAVLVADVLAATSAVPLTTLAPAQEMSAVQESIHANGSNDLAISNIWRIMAERTTQSWTSVPHIFLLREVNTTRLMGWREQLLKRLPEKITYTDLLVKIVAMALRDHPRINASWADGRISLNSEINIGLAVAIEDGLVVPVLHQADKLSLGDITHQRKDLVARAQVGKLRPQDLQRGTFTISNLGMYGVDAFTAIINPPQSAILAVSRMVERVVPLKGQPVIQPMMTLSLSCDHRVIDGARGAQFLATLADLIEEPLGLLS